MKRDEDLRPENDVEFYTDDEENQAEVDDDPDSDDSNGSPGPIENPIWPQSYRFCIDFSLMCDNMGPINVYLNCSLCLCLCLC